MHELLGVTCPNPDPAEAGRETTLNSSEQRGDSISGHAWEIDIEAKTTLHLLPKGPWRSLGGYLDYTDWSDRDRFIELDDAIHRKAYKRTRLLPGCFEISSDAGFGAVERKETVRRRQNRELKANTGARSGIASCVAQAHSFDGAAIECKRKRPASRASAGTFPGRAR